MASPEPWVAVAIAPAIEMCGSDARLCSATPCAASASASSPYLSQALQVTVPAARSTSTSAGRASSATSSAESATSLNEWRVPSARTRGARGDDLAQLRRASSGGAARRRGRRGCRPSWRAGARQALPRARSISRPRTRPPSARRALCSYSLVSHGRRPRMRAGGLLGEGALDVHVLGVDRGGDRHLVGGQAIGVVEARPLALGEDVGRLAQRGQRPELLEHPREDVLAHEQLGLLARSRRAAGARPPSASSRRRPSTPPAARRRAGCARSRARPRRRGGRPASRRAARGCSAGPRRRSLMPSRLPSWRSRRAVRRSPDGRRTSSALEAVAQRAHPLAVVRVALVVAPAALERARVGRAVDVVDARPDRRQAAGDEGLAQPLGRDRQVGHDAQPAEALAEHAPALDAQLPADVLGVAHDRVGAEVREVLGLLGARQPGQRADRASSGRSRAGRA